MGCACKQVRQLNERYKKPETKERKFNIYKILKNALLEIINKLLQVLLLIIVSPIVMLVLILNVLIFNKMKVTLPKKFYKFVYNNHKMDLENNGEQ